MYKTLITILILLTFSTSADVSVKDFLAYLQGKTEQADSHIADTVSHVVQTNKNNWNYIYQNGVTNNQSVVNFGTLNLNSLIFPYGNFTSVISNIVDGTLSNVYNSVLEPTGFESPESITVSYDKDARTVTLTQTGGIVYWWRGNKYSLTSPWTSTAHATNNAVYYLAMRTSTNAVWSNDPWTFDMLQMAYSKVDGVDIGFRECHGLMQWQGHKEAHANIGCYRRDGCFPDPTTFAVTPATASDASNSPSFLSGHIEDEDCEMIIDAWPENTYSILYFSGSNTVEIITNYPSMFRTNGVANSYAMVNTYNGSTFSTNTVTQANRWLNYYQILVPVSADVHSQRYRTLILQPQIVYTSLASAQAEDFRSLYLGEFTTIATEFVAFTKFTVGTAAGYNNIGKTRIDAVSYLTGSKSTQVSISQLSTPNTASSISTDTSNFNNRLSASDTTVQLALDTVDNFEPPVYDSSIVLPTIGTITNTISIVTTNKIYRLTVTNANSEVVLDLSALNTNKVARWETWITVSTTNISLVLPSTNLVYYITSPVATTVTNQTHYITWQYFVSSGVTNIFSNTWLTK